MTIDLQAVKAKTLGDSSAQTGNGGNNAKNTGNIGFDFAEIMRNKSMRLENGINILSDRAGISAVAENTGPASRIDDHAYDGNNSRAESYDHHDSDSQRAPERDTSMSSDRSNDYDQGHSDNSASASDHDTHDSGADNHAENRGENAPASESRQADNNSSDDGNTDNNGEVQASSSSNDSENGEQTATNEGAVAGTNGKGNADTNGKSTATATTAQQMLSSLLAEAANAGKQGQTTDKGGEQLEKTEGRKNAAKGLNAALANATKQVAADPSAAGRTAANAQTQQAQANAAVANGADMQAKEKSAKAATGMTNAAQQAAQMSRMVGDGAKVAVSVDVADESAKMVSKPTTSLTPNATLANDQNAQGQLGRQGLPGQNTANAAIAGQASGQAGQNANQAQQSVQQAVNAQTQAVGAASAAAKGAVQGTMQAGAQQAVMAGGGEANTAAGPNGTNASHQAQQNTSAQAANGTRFTMPGQAVADQVSVQITKALNAGSDKISIQLKPAEMGRVDVRMEVTADGRTMAVITADNKSTLDLLQRDARDLQQALQDAGLQMDHDSLSFNLREQENQGEENQTAGSGSLDEEELTEAEILAAAAGENGGNNAGNGIIADDRVDIRA